MPCLNCHCENCLAWREQQVIESTARRSTDPASPESAAVHLAALRETVRNANRPTERTDR